MSAQKGPRVCVIGWPVGHSRSPIIHRHWLSRNDLPGSYTRWAVPPDEIDKCLGSFGAHGFSGANVTIPFKENAFCACGRLEPTAEALGVVNTLWIEDGVLCGDNTDVAGFLANLDERAPGWKAKGGPAVVIGAGGAARAVVYGLLKRGMTPIRLVNRTLARAIVLSRALESGKKKQAHIECMPLHDLNNATVGARLLVNTTSLGMVGHDPLEVDLRGLETGAVVSDVVYTPLRTDLLIEADRQGYRGVDGLGMLLHQAVPGFVRWFGVRPVVDETLRAAVISNLGADPGTNCGVA